MDTTGIRLVMRVDVQKLHLNVDVCVISGKNRHEQCTHIAILKPTFQLFAHEMSIQLSLCY